MSSAGGTGQRLRGIQRMRFRGHRAAVRSAEVTLLADELAPFGVLARDELARRCHPAHWHEGTFDLALQAGVERGVFELRPGGSVALRRRRFSRRRRPAGATRPLGPTDTRGELAAGEPHG